MTQKVYPRRVPAGTVPLMSYEGTAYECGFAFGEDCREDVSGPVATVRDLSPWWEDPRSHAAKVMERYAPHVADLYRGLAKGLGLGRGETPRVATEPPPGNCTSFGVSGAVTLEGAPISGQNKDPSFRRAHEYRVLRMKIEGAPAILTVTYPGQLHGHGFWSRPSGGMSIFRNSLYVKPSEKGLDSADFAQAALACRSVDEVAELARREGVLGAGNHLYSDADGGCISVEFGADGIGIVEAADGILTHANHVNSEIHLAYENYEPQEHKVSFHRQARLAEVLAADRGRLTPQKALMALADHDGYPDSVCRHRTFEKPEHETCASIVAEPTLGRIHVTRGMPCMNWAVTYSLD